jgi:hypothetical protein
MIQFINMDFNGTQWWVEYIENNQYKKDYFSTEADAIIFYKSII